jgi:hypothetical protein
MSKQRNNSIQEVTRPGSVTPEEAVTFLKETVASEDMTDDWYKSLLYLNIKNEKSGVLPLTAQEITVLAKKPPRENQSIMQALSKGLDCLRTLLLELLGTKEDMERFEERFRVISPGHVRALMEKCLSLFHVREKTGEILKSVIERENLMKSLAVSNNRVKQKVVSVYRLNKIIREKIEAWINDESIPFQSFTFKGENYLHKIAEDSVLLHNYLASPQVLYTQYQ